MKAHFINHIQKGEENMKQFVIIGSLNLDLNDPKHRPFGGSTFNEFNLRKWASRFGVDKEASLAEIATAIKSGGWTLFQYIPPEE